MKKGMNIDLEITGENCDSVNLIPTASYNFTFSPDITSEQAISFFSLLHKSGLKEDHLSVPHTALLTLKQMPMLPQHSDATKIFQITL